MIGAAPERDLGCGVRYTAGPRSLASLTPTADMRLLLLAPRQLPALHSYIYAVGFTQCELVQVMGALA